MSPDLAPATHLLSIALLLGPPTLAMGATIPVFELVGRTTGTSVAPLYGINTAGAALGVILFSFVLVPLLGVGRTCASVAGINFFVALLAVLLDRRTQPGPSRVPEVDSSAVSTHARSPIGIAGLVVFTTGFVTFGLEVAWFRSLRAAFQTTTESFAVILASVLIPLAISARLVPRLRRLGVSPRKALVAAGIAILLATPLLERMDQIVRFYVQSMAGDAGASASAASTLDYVWLLVTWLGTAIGIMGPSIFFLGITLPWYLEEFAEPSATGRVYALNTLGAVAALAIAVVTTSNLGTIRVQGPKVLEGHRVVAFAEGPDSTVAVMQGPAGVRRLLIDGFVATTSTSST